MLDMQTFAAMLAVDVRHASRICASGRVPAKNVAMNPASRKKLWRVKLSDALRYRDEPDNTPTPQAVRRRLLPPGVRELV